MDPELIRTEFPHAVRVIDNVWIPLSDGCRLAARLWLPNDAEAHPVPTLLEYIPYRKDDWTAIGDSMRHAYLAGHGYACLRVDIRGSGGSDGILEGKYLKREQDDALEVLRWIRNQSWSTGSCGMFGLSWGGYSSLQVAARRPPELKAIISVCASDDRYADDVGYVGGALLGLHAISWPSMMLAFNARPPDPGVVGDDWRAMWLRRMAETPPFIEAALLHQSRDAHWEHGSVREDYGAIACPVFAIGGWADCFRNGLFRLLGGLPGPKKGLIGPWGHQYPEEGVPGPRIGFLQESVRWWDYWLKGIDTGIMDEPTLRAWMPDPVEPRTAYERRPGRWISERAWPSPMVETQPMELSFLSNVVPNTKVVGLAAGCWCGFGVNGDFAPDQRREDALSLCSTSQPLDEPIEILGFPSVNLTLISDRPQAQVAVRLCDVDQDGSSFLVTRGILNLTHRDSHAAPCALEPGVPITVEIELNAIAHAFHPGHRVRVGLSSTYWPWAWPSPETVQLTVLAGELRLPVRITQKDDLTPPKFSTPEYAAPLSHDVTDAPSSRRAHHEDLAKGHHRLMWDHDPSRGVRRKLANGLEFGTVGSDSYSITDGRPVSAVARSKWVVHLARDGWRIRLESAGTLSADASDFRAAQTLKAFEGNHQVFSEEWIFRVPRKDG
jgi:uncharacterized protein